MPPPTSVRPHAGAVRLTRDALAIDDRILLMGGSGWFGRSMLGLLWYAIGEKWVRSHVLATAATTRTIDVWGCGEIPVRAASAAEIAQFAPSIVVNCAFPTRNRVGELGHEEYVRQAVSQTSYLLTTVKLPTVTRAITLSSGAAVPSPKFPADIQVNPYGVLKAQEEKQFLELAAELGVAAQVARVWTVSGPHVQHPANYALSGFALQAARTGIIHVLSQRPVFRSYAAVDDVLAVALGLVSQRCGLATGLFDTGLFDTGLFDTGLFDTDGEITEIGELAALVSQHYQGSVVVRPTFDAAAPADDFRPAASNWLAVCNSVGLQPEDLPSQVARTVAGAAGWQ